jgi:hypothetical protein
MGETSQLEVIRMQTLEAIAPKLAHNELPAQNVAEIAADMQQPITTMLDWLKAQPVPVMWFEGTWVVSGEGAIAAIEYFSKDIAQRCLARRGLLKSGAVSATMKPDGKAAAKLTAKSVKPTAKKPAAKKAAAKTTAKAKKPEPTAV